MSNDVLIEVERLGRDFGERRAVHDLSFTVRRGEVVGFLGPNGAGKTTTLRMLSGTLAPGRGRIAIAGHDLQRAPLAAKRATGYLPEPPPLLPDLRVADYLAFGASLHGLTGARGRGAVDDALARCGLGPVAGRRIGNLSKGYRQRVGLAQAIVHRPSVLLLDEPTTGLDPNQLLAVRELFAELARDSAVLLSTHLLSEVRAVCSHVQLLHEGELRHSGALAGFDAAVATRLRCRFARPCDRDRIAALDGVERVELNGDGGRELTVVHRAGDSPAEALAGLAVAAGWGLLEMTPERASLEALFLRLTGEGGAA